MAHERELTATYLVLAKCFVETVPYDAEGAFILLHSITDGLGDAAPGFMDTALHLHVMAGLSVGGQVQQDARDALVEIAGALERRLVFKSST